MWYLLMGCSGITHGREGLKVAGLETSRQQTFETAASQSQYANTTGAVSFRPDGILPREELALKAAGGGSDKDALSFSCRLFDALRSKVYITGWLYKKVRTFDQVTADESSYSL
jgi:hypothetical protein